ncbi:cell division protein FtsK, partial [Streptomyces sp. NPDC059389]
MASRTSGKGSQSAAGTAKGRTGRTTAPAKKAAAARGSAAKKTAAPRRAPARKAPPKPAPSPTGGVVRLVRAVWLGCAHAVGAVFRGVGQGAKNLDPAHRKDGVALLLLALALIVAAGTWSNLSGPVGDLVTMLVTGAFGRLDLLVPILLGVMAVRFIRHPEQPDANGRIGVGLSALAIGVLGLVHIACGAPGRDEGTTAMQNAGGLIGWGASKPLIFTMGAPLAVPMLVLLTIFGLLVVTATPVNAIPQRLRRLGIRLGIIAPNEYDEGYAEGGAPADRHDAEQWRARSGAAGPGASTDAAGPAGSADAAEEQALARRRRPRRAPARPAAERGMDAVDVA